MDKIPQMASDWIHNKVLNLVKDLINKDFKILVAACWQWAFEEALIENLRERWISPENIIPIDINEEQYIWPSKKNFIKADLNFPLQELWNESIDIVICIETIEHISNQQTLISEFCRIIKKDNSYLVITSPNCESIASRLFYFVKWVFPSFTEVNFQWNWHIIPFFSWTLDYFTRGKDVKIIKYDSNSFHFWIIPYLWKVYVPFKSILFAETNIWLLKKGN
jgi:hypothetical protein